ncbi:MAG: tRNA-intron lyase [Halobacteriaceae archaeon]
MDGRVRNGVVVVGGDARQRFHDARGYGRPLDQLADGPGDQIALAPVEAAHLLFRGDLDTVDGADFQTYLEGRDAAFLPLFLVYADLRARGFYLSPAREDWVEDPATADLVVYPRGQGPDDGDIAHRVRVVDERSTLDPVSLTGCVLAVVDEESEITYFDTAATGPTGDGTPTPPPAGGHLLGDRVIAWDPPAELHDTAFYGQPLDDRDPGGPLQLSLVEAAYLGAEGVLTLESDAGLQAVIDRGRAVEGDRFDRRLQTYRALRGRGLVPKTGFKFGADFRVYDAFESLENIGHSVALVRVLEPDTSLHPRDLALDVRLAHGVRKTMVFAVPDTEAVDWHTVTRLTP